ncbi:Rho GTPase activation protein [Cokeromyces recurvatus]|uniref:Rho GTPase activation protein n=1 Tax=Cokeromyces recurvatus TaxID=90255 RepID=UPI00221EDE8F|nr:Rho GTPase activation protein [Cokeromyces recurvatus]KAI7906874.1 Rho GTPase activation protein [Cokeromyces recurvatus]
MRELIARKEGQNDDTEIMRLLKSLTIDESQMKVNRKITQEHVEDKKSLGHWFSSKPNSSDNNFAQKYQYAQSQSSNDHDVFGGYLNMEENGDIPHVVSLCIKEVEARGLKSVGIYRLSGPASTIQKYKLAFNKGKRSLYVIIGEQKKIKPITYIGEHVSFREEHDINTVTGLLKLYFRELKQPLMTYEYYGWFIEAASK